jgi:hypothetical protein
MLSPTESSHALPALFRDRRIADLPMLFQALRTQSRMSVFRRLSPLGYLTSYSHAGRFYTLPDIPVFDQDGIWRYQGVGFSRHGSLKATVTHLVEQADAGRTHRELQVRLLVRVHNTLLELVRQERIRRQSILGQYLYVSADAARADLQARLRRQQLEAGVGQVIDVTAPVLIEVLLELVQGAGVRLDPSLMAERIRARGMAVTAEQVEEIFLRHGVKKTAGSRSRFWRP